MYQKTAFDRLVGELTAEERVQMLKEIEASTVAGDDPLFAPPEEGESPNIEAEYSRLWILKRIFLYFKALLSRRTPFEIFEDSLLRKSAEDLERASGGMFQARTRTVSGRFADELKGLRDALSPFVEPLSRAFGTEKKEFVSLLAGFEIPLHQERLLELTNPDNYSSKTGLVSASDIKKQMFVDLDASLKDISDSDRSEVYTHMRSLHCLTELVFFQFSSILEHFDVSQIGEAVSLELVKDQLVALGDVLCSQGRPPGQNALKALFLFDTADDQTRPDTLEEYLKERIEKANRGIVKIRAFAGLLPFRKLLKVCTGNIGYTPASLGGGEDWFALYRKFWEERAETTVEEYSFRHKKRFLLEEASDLLNVHELQPLKGYSSRLLDESLRVRFESTLAFVDSFVAKLFLREMHPVLKIFLVDADFYKSQNRQQFTDAYNGLRGAEGEIEKLEAELSKDGLTGKALEEYRQEIDEQSAQHDRLREMMRTIDARAEEIVTSARDDLGMLINVIKGILYGESGGRFDTLANISYIGGSENQRLIERLGNVLKQAEEARRIINELYDLERFFSD